MPFHMLLWFGIYHFIMPLELDWLLPEHGEGVDRVGDVGEMLRARLAFAPVPDLARDVEDALYAVAFTSWLMTSRAGFLSRISGSMKRRLPASSRRTLSLVALTSVTARSSLPKK